MRTKLFIEDLTGYEAGKDFHDTCKAYLEQVRAVHTADFFEVAIQATLNDFLEATIRNEVHNYLIVEHFGRSLKDTKLNIPCRILSDLWNRKHYCIHFPFYFIQEGARVYNAVVRYAHDSKGGRTLHMLFPQYDCMRNFKQFYTVLTFSLEKPTIQESVDALEGGDILNTDLVLFILKCILYIETGSPDIYREYGKACNSGKLKKQKAHLKKAYPIDVEKVGYSYHKRHVLCLKTAVKSHFRWQRYGDKFSKVKLIEIKEHTRNYKKEV